MVIVIVPIVVIILITTIATVSSLGERGSSLVSLGGTQTVLAFCCLLLAAGCWRLAGWLTQSD